MAEVPERSLERIHSLGQVEQSMSIDPRVSREKQKEQHKQKKRKYQPTIEEQLEEEQILRNIEDQDEKHIDFHA